MFFYAFYAARFADKEPESPDYRNLSNYRGSVHCATFGAASWA